MTTRRLVGMASIPRLPAGVRLRDDPVRGRLVVLGPERVLLPDDLATEVLVGCDGRQTVGVLVGGLAARHLASIALVERDVVELLQGLCDDGWIDIDIGRAASAEGPEVARAAAQIGRGRMQAPTGDARALPPPIGLLAEMTHRCPLRCPYCSNPTELVRAREELDGATWSRVFTEAAALGVLQLHLSGGEPLLRDDILDLIVAARAAGLYVNLVTSGHGLDERRALALARAGVEHVQVSLQDVDAARGDGVAGHAGAHQAKLVAARAVRAVGLPLTINWVVHRANADAAAAMIELSRDLGASRVEIAHAQLHGWGLRNRDALVPTRAQVDQVAAVVEQSRSRWLGVMKIDAVVPEVWARRPKACMEGWGRRFIVVDPRGDVLPCHAAATLPGLVFDSVRERGLGAIWRESSAFEHFRGTEWMREPCRSCDRREIDWGGCRCQALAFAGDATAVDPACELSPLHASFRDVGLRADERPRIYVHRGRVAAPVPPALPAPGERS